MYSATSVDDGDEAFACLHVIANSHECIPATSVDVDEAIARLHVIARRHECSLLPQPVDADEAIYLFYFFVPNVRPLI